MPAQLQSTPSGRASLKWDGDWLEDPVDPVAGAAASIRREQVAGADYVVLFGAGLGYRLLWLKELGVVAPIVYEPQPEVLDLGRKTLPGAYEGVSAFCDQASLLAHLRGRLSGFDRMKLIAPPPYPRVFPTEHQLVKDCLRDALGFAQLRRNTVSQRLSHMVECALVNMPKLAGVPMLASLAQPLRGCPAFVVAAGPSLDKTAPLLAEAARRGAILAVNTSAPAVAGREVRMDAVVCIEGLPVTETLQQVAPYTGVLALDLIAHPASFDVEVHPKVAFLSNQSGLDGLAAALGVAATPYGPSVATAAFRLAFEWGADPIILLGQDLAYPGGRLYATGTGRERWRADPCGGTLRFAFDEHLDRLFEAQGWKAPAREQPRLSVRAWGGGTVDSSYDMIWFRRWYEDAVAALSGQRQFINATEGGARIAGFEERTLASLLPALPERQVALAACAQTAPPLSRKRIDRARRSLREAARQVVRQADRGLQGGAVDGARAKAAVRAAQRSSLVWAHAAPELQRIAQDHAGDPRRSARATVVALRRSAQRVAALLS